MHSIVDFQAATPCNSSIRMCVMRIASFFWGGGGGGGGGVEVNIMEKSKVTDAGNR